MNNEQPFEIRDAEQVAEEIWYVRKYYINAANAEIRRLQEQVLGFERDTADWQLEVVSLRKQLDDAPTWGEWVDADAIPKNIDDSFYEVECLDGHTELWTMQRLNGYYSKVFVGKIKEHEIKQFRRLNYVPQPAREVEKTYIFPNGSIMTAKEVAENTGSLVMGELARDLLAAQAQIRELLK